MPESRELKIINHEGSDKDLMSRLSKCLLEMGINDYFGLLRDKAITIFGRFTDDDVLKIKRHIWFEEGIILEA